MGFDLPSFGAGAAVGVAGSAAGYQIWQRWQARRDEEIGRMERETINTTNRSIDNPYHKALIAFCQQNHLMGHRLNLTKLLIEPRFIRMEDMVTLPDEDDILRSVFDQVPRIHDYPFLHSPYHIPTISIDDLSRGERHITIVGRQGSGCTTALMAIALWSLEQINFKLPSDPVQQRLDEAEKELSAEERAERIRQRVALMQRAQERYAEEKNKEASEIVDPGVYETDDDDTSQRPTFRDRMPIYIHLADILPFADDYGRRIDPAEPIIRAVQHQVGGLAAKRIVGQIYRILKSGRGLMLFDGLDDIPHTDQPAILDWLQAFIKLYDRNAVIMASSFDHYGTLHQVGMVPVFLRPWSTQLVQNAAQKWATNWGNISEQAQTMDDETLETYIARAHLKHRAQPAFELSLNLWTTYAGQQLDQTKQIQAYLSDRLDDASSIQPALEHLAVMQLDEGYIRLERLVEIAVNQALAKSRATLEAQVSTTNVADAEDDTDGAGANEDRASQEGLSPEDIEKALAKEERQLQRDYTKEHAARLKRLKAAGVIIEYCDGRYQFQHVFLAGYLGAQTLIDLDDATVTQKLKQPAWKVAIPYTLQQRPLDALVSTHLDNPVDLLYNNILTLTRWLPYAGTSAPWRGRLLQYLGNLMVADNQFALVRERIAAALVSSRDTGALIVFRRALQHPNPEVRRLGCLSVGALFDEDTTAHLSNMALDDPDEAVQIAATMALGAFGTEKSLLTIAELLQVSDSADVRRAAAESFAAYPEMGYPTLHEGLRDRDIMMRRAVVFGLGRVPAPWALIELNETYLEDDEWYVRIAAQVALGDIYEASLKGVHHYPGISGVDWLKIWREDQVQKGNIPFDLEGMDLLHHAFKQTDDPLARVLAVLTMGQIGLHKSLELLYEALRDRHAYVRDAAYRALAMFQNQLSEPLPAPA